MPTVESEVFRDTLANFPAGVVVVTSMAEDEPVGLTASSFCSVSVDPPLVSVCINSASSSLASIRARRGFTVNMLSGECEHIAIQFASKGDRFRDLELIPTDEGGPILMGHISAYLVCDLHDEIEAGTHRILVGRVLDADVLHENTLVYHQRRFFGCENALKAG